MASSRNVGLLTLVFGAAPFAVAHPVSEQVPQKAGWSFEPLVVIPLIVTGILFAAGGETEMEQAPVVQTCKRLRLLPAG